MKRSMSGCVYRYKAPLDRINYEQLAVCSSFIAPRARVGIKVIITLLLAYGVSCVRRERELPDVMDIKFNERRLGDSIVPRRRY